MKKITTNHKQQTTLKNLIRKVVIPAILFMCFAISTHTTNAQATTWWYNNGVPDSVFLQTDVFSFRCFGGVAYTGGYDTTVIDSIIHRSTRPDAANDVFFDPGTTLPQRLAAVQSIDSTGQLEIFYLNISTTTDPFSSNNWYTLDDKILVNFTTTYPDSLTIDSFMNKYSLTLEYEPLDSLPVTTGCSYTYIFKFNLPSNQPNGFMYVPELLQDMFEDSTHVACLASPNVVNIRVTPSTGTPPEPLEPQADFIYDMCGTGDPNDEFRDYQWYIHNDGFNEFDFQPGVNCPPGGIFPTDGTPGADAKICECWDKGLTGEGIRVGIIATGDIYFSPNNHYDLLNQAYDPADMWDCTFNPCQTLVSNSSTGNGMRMGGIVAATKNNNYGIAGIAEEAVLCHIKVGDAFISVASMIRALQKALEIKVDVVATEYFSPIFNPSIMLELRIHNDLGRVSHPANLGTILIAPAGHTETNITGTALDHYPARFNYDETPNEPEVIGVIGSNFYDKLAAGWLSTCFQNAYTPGSINYSYPSNFGNQYDIAVPSTNFFSTEQTFMTTRFQTSASYQDADDVAIAAGVVALLLDDKYNQTFLEMRNRLRSGADKVGGYSYSLPLQHSLEFAAGRINCINSLAGWPLNVGTINNENQTIHVLSTPENWDIQFKGLTIGAFKGTLHNISGQVISTFLVEEGNSNFLLSHSKLSSGLYIIQLRNDANSFTVKAIK